MVTQKAATGSAELYDLIGEECTTNDIQALLRAHKSLGVKKLKITGENKEDILANLKNAITDGLIPIDDAYDLLRKKEENGRQYIFLYRPKSDTARNILMNAAEIGGRLLGPAWSKNNSFPTFELLPDTTTLVDFRIEPSEDKKTACWTIKYYGSRNKNELIEDTNDGRVIRKAWQITKVRTVYIVRVNQFGLLEVRVPRWDSIQEVKLMRNEVWKLITRLNLKSLVYEYNLLDNITELVKKRRQNVDAYRVGITRLRDDSGGTSTFAPADEEEDISSIEIYDKAIGQILNARNICNHVCIHWVVNGNSDRLNTKFCLADVNDMCIGSRTDAEVINYVTHRLISITD